MVGVTPTAAYRHFAGKEELLEAAKQEALARLLTAMNTELRAQPQREDPLARALGKLTAIGRGYVRFAMADQGLFRTAFSCDGLDMPTDQPTNGGEGQGAEDNAFAVLVAVMDELVQVGYLPPQRRAMAEFAAWSTVHGLAMLFLDGPMRHAEEVVREEAMARTLLIFVEGLAGATLSPEQRAIITS